MHKSGFVNIIGNPNVGKSTLLNALLGETLSITSPKAQTTRHRIIGLLNADDYQIVFSDTPGMVNPHYKLQESMLSVISGTLQDADVFLLLTAPGEDFKNENIINAVTQSEKPVILLINKIDLSKQEEIEEQIAIWKEKMPKAYILPVSALHSFNVDVVVSKIVELLPEGEAFYDKGDISDRNMRFFVSEVVREKILKYYDKEIPYAVEVVVEDYRESENIDRIRVLIFVERESQKAIIIGRKGEALKRVGQEARKDLEKRFQKKIFLETHVKVMKNWRDNEKSLKQFGYEL